MANDKEIKFSARLDDSQLNQDIQNFSKKLKDMQNIAGSGQKISQAAGAAGLPQMSPATQQAFDAAFKRQQDNAKQYYESSKKQLEDTAAQNSKISKEIERQTALSKDQTKSLNERNAAEKELLRLKGEQAKADENLVKNAQTAAAAAKMAGMSGDKTSGDSSSMLSNFAKAATGGNLQGMLVALGGSALVIGAIAKAVTVGFQAYQTHTAAPMVAAAAQGSAINTLYGREVNAIYSGNNQLESSYSPEKLEAMRIAKGQRTGHEIGNIFSIQGVMAAFGNEGAKKAQSALLNQQLAGDRDTTLSGLINQDPFRKAATDQYYANAPKNLQFQRQMGLNYDSFHSQGGFRQHIINGGFDDSLGMEMSQQIMGAGGSTGSSGKSSALLGLQAQRNFNLTNAGNILGKLGSTTANPNESKESLIRILAEGTKLGFDGSRYVEESRKFTETVADIIAKSGSGSPEDAARNAKNFAGFVADPTTTQGINAAKSAYEIHQAQTGATSGRQGAVKLSAFMSNSILRQMSLSGRTNLMGMNQNEITENNSDVVSFAREQTKMGNKMSPQDVLSLLKKEVYNNPNVVGGGQGGFGDRVKEYQKLRLKSRSGISGDELASTQERMQSLGDEIESKARQAVPGEMTDAASTSQRNSILNSEEEGYNQVPTGAKLNRAMLGGYGSREEIGAKLGSQSETGKIEDRTQRNDAESASEMLKSFRDNKDTIVQTTEAIKIYNAALRENIALTKQGAGDLSGTGTASKIASAYASTTHLDYGPAIDLIKDAISGGSKGQEQASTKNK